jgi:hypothetical protein
MRLSVGSDDQASTMRPNNVECGPLGPFIGCCDGRHCIGVHERVRAVEGVEGVHQAIKRIALCRTGSRPGGQSHTVPEPASEIEEVDGAFGSEFDYGVVERQVEVGEIGSDVVAPKQRIGQRSSAVEDLVGKLAPQHQVIGESLAGDLLG